MQIHALALRVQLEVKARIVIQNRGSALLSHRHEVILLLVHEAVAVHGEQGLVLSA